MRFTLRVGALRWGAIVVALVVWEALARALGSGAYFAPPSRVFTTGPAYLGRADTLDGLGVTTVRFLAAFAITAVLGVGLGLVLGRAGRLLPPARDVFGVLYPVPLVPFYPLFVLWLGLGFRSEVAFGAVDGVVPVNVVLHATERRLSRWRAEQTT